MGLPGPLQERRLLRALMMGALYGASARMPTSARRLDGSLPSHRDPRVRLGGACATGVGRRRTPDQASTPEAGLSARLWLRSAERAKYRPISNNTYIGMARRTWLITSGGVRMAAAMTIARMA